ncbi:MULTISPECIES: beta-ketoacyl-ACP synthase II [unclassified Apibacter]|uniref:beta-ketoacyl-ACP synthase II n=1 Tax=unclassified Apibacter TaxID=2630820 RepID=UPI00135DC319|nr:MULTISPECIES: beta-ketoacyl-ACP synthase II [unclassified Apibacter]MXP05984.1 beta-ketoacyl-ACP synthase II [Apibacter sp. B3546]MXP12092.1 beta-ketoacyl-ACP synthase II [Apibacter sp. B3239]
MALKRVVVTGLGAITPIGNNFKEYCKALLSGVSGASPITLFDATNFKTKFACEVKNYNPEDYFEKKDIRKYDRCAQFGLISTKEAVIDSKILEYSDLNKDRVGVVWGSGIGGLNTFEQEITAYALGKGTPRFNPFFIPKMIADMTAGLISIEYGFRGPNYATVSACASSSNSIIDALMLLRLGKADVIITGGSEAGIVASGVGGFNALHAMSTRNDDPKTASRPFDKDRDGFVLGEGAGTLILEEYEHAVKRGATIYAEVVGGGLSSDAYHMTAPHPEGLGAYNVMKNAIEDAGIELTDINHINVHGTSTPLGDLAESKAILKLFGEHAYNIQINSTKSMTGHLLGAAGAIEALACIVAIRENKVPPTINHFTDDEEFDKRLDFTFNVAKEKQVNYAMSNTFGFGGHNACVILKKF